MIGDDEHGWSDEGIFNFEGGCYAKTIKLDPTAEPEIYATTQRFGTILENVVIDPADGSIDLDDGRYTENTRASYPSTLFRTRAPTGIARRSDQCRYADGRRLRCPSTDQPFDA